MAIDARMLPDGDPATGTSESQLASLDMLNLRNSQRRDPQAVADYLVAVVPGLRTLNVEGDRDTYRMWKLVQRLMKGTVI